MSGMQISCCSLHCPGPDTEGDLLDCDMKSDSSPEREAPDDETKGPEGPDGIKKRKRKPYRPGKGGLADRLLSNYRYPLPQKVQPAFKSGVGPVSITVCMWLSLPAGCLLLSSSLG